MKKSVSCSNVEKGKFCFREALLLSMSPGLTEVVSEITSEKAF